MQADLVPVGLSFQAQRAWLARGRHAPLVWFWSSFGVMEEEKSNKEKKALYDFEEKPRSHFCGMALRGYKTGVWPQAQATHNFKSLKPEDINTFGAKGCMSFGVIRRGSSSIRIQQSTL